MDECEEKVIRDLLWTRGLGVYTTCIARNKVLFHWEEHHRRLIESCKGARIDHNKLPPSNELQLMIWGAIDQKGCQESIVWISVSGGESLDRKTPYYGSIPRVSVIVEPFDGFNAHPLAVVFCDGGRRRPTIKMIGPYANVLVDMGEAKEFQLEIDGAERAVDDILYVDNTTKNAGMIKETAFGNFFAVTNAGELWTPAQEVLMGVTRAIALKIAKESDIFTKVEEMPKISENHFSGFDEVFRTATTSGVVPIEYIGKRKFSVGESTLTEKLRKVFLKYVDNYFVDHRA